MNLFYEAKKVLDKDGKVNPLGPYGKQKLTGREIQVYFRRNKVKDKVVKKAVEVALDLGGAMDIAIKSIKDFYGDKVLKAKEVQNALKFANEESFKDSFDMLDEDYKKVIKMYPKDRDWKKLITKHKRAIDSLRKNEKDLPKKVEDDLLTWASQAGEVGGKDDAEDFIMSIIDEGTLSEAKNLMPDLQQIVDTKSASKVGGIMVDMFTASMITQIYGKVNDSNKKKMEKSNISTLVGLAQKMMQKMGDNIAEEVKTTLSEAPYDDKDVKNVKKLQSKLEKMLKEVDKTMKGSGLSAPAFSMVRGGIRKGLEQIEKFYKVASNTIKEGTMAIGIKDRDSKEREKAQKKLSKMLKKDGNKKVGSKEGQKFDEVLDGQILSDDELADEFANPKNKNMKVKDLLKKHAKRLNVNFDESVEEGNAVSSAQQAAIAIAKKKKNESVMDSYRQMWEESLTEEVQDITVDPKNKKFSSPSDQNYHGMEIAKQARRFGLKSSVLGKHVRIKGAKKKVNDFLRVVIGKEKYGDPTNGDYTTPQINKMLTKGLK